MSSPGYYSPPSPVFTLFPPWGRILTGGDRLRRWSADGRTLRFRSGWWQEDKRHLHLPLFYNSPPGEEDDGREGYGGSSLPSADPRDAPAPGLSPLNGLILPGFNL